MPTPIPVMMQWLVRKYYVICIIVGNNEINIVVSREVWYVLYDFGKWSLDNLLSWKACIYYVHRWSAYTVCMHTYAHIGVWAHIHSDFHTNTRTHTHAPTHIHTNYNPRFHSPIPILTGLLGSSNHGDDSNEDRCNDVQNGPHKVHLNGSFQIGMSIPQKRDTEDTQANGQLERMRWSW